jgi:hypothetical protein
MFEGKNTALAMSKCVEFFKEVISAPWQDVWNYRRLAIKLHMFLSAAKIIFCTYSLVCMFFQRSTPLVGHKAKTLLNPCYIGLLQLYKWVSVDGSILKMSNTWEIYCRENWALSRELWQLASPSTPLSPSSSSRPQYTHTQISTSSQFKWLRFI